MTERGRLTAGLALATVGPLVLAPVLAPGHGISPLFGLLVVVGYAGHVAVTAVLWTVPDVRRAVRDRSLRTVALPVAIVLLAMAMGVSLGSHTLRLLLLGFFAWQFDHFQRQNLGLAKRVTALWSSEPTGDGAGRPAVIAGWCGIGALLARPSLLGLPIATLPGFEASVVVPVAATGFAACTVAAVVAALARPRPWPAAAASLAAVVFVAPIFLFHDPQAAVTGMVVAHGLQYLWVVRWRSREARVSSGGVGWPATFAVLSGAVLGGSMLEAMSELHSARPALLRALYGAYLGVVMAHFALDAVLWRRRSAGPATMPSRAALLPSFAPGRL